MPVIQRHLPCCYNPLSIHHPRCKDPLSITNAAMTRTATTPVIHTPSPVIHHSRCNDPYCDNTRTICWSYTFSIISNGTKCITSHDARTRCPNPTVRSARTRCPNTTARSARTRCPNPTARSARTRCPNHQTLHTLQGPVLRQQPLSITHAARSRTATIPVIHTPSPVIHHSRCNDPYCDNTHYPSLTLQ